MAYYYEDAFRVWELLDKWNHQGPPDIPSLKGLFHRDPQIAKYVGLRGRTFVHFCLEFYAYRHLELLECFIDAHPKALYHEDEEGRLPIHVALMAQEQGNSSILRVLELLLLKSGPEILFYQHQRTGGLPLHTACKSYFARTIPILKTLVEPFPDALRHPDDEGKYPLHHALEQESPDPQIMAATGQLRATLSQPESIAYLIDACPAILTESIPDRKGLLPLHRAVLSPLSSPRTIEILIEKFPRALRIQDCRSRQTPLQMACQDEDASLTTVYSLIRQWPDQVLTQSHVIFETHKFNGELLTSSAASNAASLEMVEEWTRNGKTVQELLDVDTHGRLPIHYAVVSRSSDALEMVRHMVELVPECLKHADKYGRVPLHYATVSRKKSVSVLRYVMEEYPKALTVKDCEDRLPWHYAEFADPERGEMLLERTIQGDPDMDYYLVPEEVRWDIVQVCDDHGSH